MKWPPIVVVATQNKGKAVEFADMLGDGQSHGGGSTQFRDLSAYPDIGDVEETGHTFRANACLKASEYAKRTGQWALADDSGLEVDALGGKPGVVSARWAAIHSAGKGDADNNTLLLKQLENVPDEKRTARFVCVLALADARGRIIFTAQGSMEGHIIRQPRGENGFGYDPLFWVDRMGKTTAELSKPEKAAISHRGEALRRLKELVAATSAGPQLAES